MVDIDTAHHPIPEREDYWRACVCDQFVALSVEPRAGLLRGKVAGDDIAETKLRRIRATRHSFERRAADIRADDPEVLHLLLMDRGTTQVEQDGRTASLQPGHLLLYDSSRPFRFETAAEFQFTIALVPKRLLPVPDHQVRQNTARAFDSRQGVGAALAPFLVSIANHTHGTGASQQLAMQHALTNMYVALMADPEGSGQHPPSVHLQLAKSFLNRHLGDPNLAPADVATACNISLSYLHRIFAADDTTVAGYLREQRLQAAHRDLTTSLLDELIHVVGARWGLPDPAHFSRLFKGRFGITPGQARNAARGAMYPDPHLR